MKRVAVIGSRDFDDYDLLSSTLNELDFDVVVSGGARGADKLGEKYAEEHNKEKLIFLAEWNKYGKVAGYIRNQEIIDNCDEVVAFWDGRSPGTRHSIKLAKKKNIPVKIIKY